MGRIDRGARTLSRQRRQGQRDSQGQGTAFGYGLAFDPDSGTVSLKLDVDPALIFGPDGELSVQLAATGGLEKGVDGLSIDLRDTDPGLELHATGLGLLLASGAPFGLAGGLNLALATDAGLEVAGGELGVQLDGGTIAAGAGGLRVAAPEGVWTVTAVQTAAYAASPGEMVLCDPSGGTFDVNMPSALGISGRQVLIKNVTADTSGIGVVPDGSETIDGGAGLSITSAYGSARLISDGANWWQV